MAGTLNPDALGIYISVPFCRAKCSFCNFTSGVSSAEAVEHYVRLLVSEIDAGSTLAGKLGTQLPRTVDTLYFGGGTPSLLMPEQLADIFAAIRRNFDPQPDAEITLEAAPGQIGDALLQEALRLGVNRVSLGVQSFVDGEASAVGRTHTGESCLKEIERLRCAGVVDIGADVIAGLPHQTETSWRESLQAIGSAGLTHASVYMLEIDEDSRLGREALSGGLRLHAPRLPDAEAVAAFYEVACEELPRNGLAQYEISNFATSGFQSKHNRKYWERKPYMGFGLDAHSMLLDGKRPLRFSNPDDLAEYAGAESAHDSQTVSEREAFEESIFLGLRLNEGVAKTRLLEQFPHPWVEETSAAVRELCSEGLMTDEGETWRLTVRGRLLSNDVFTHLLAAVAA